MDDNDIEIPSSVKLFRKILNHVKRSFLEGNETGYSKDIHSIKRLDESVDRIQQFGNTVLSLLNDSDINTREHKSVETLFKKYNFTIPTRHNHEHGLCVYYLKNDVFMYPYDLNPSHIDIIEKS